MRGLLSDGVAGLADRLTVRLLVLMSVALLPLGVIAIMTTLNSTRNADLAAEQGLIGLTAQAVSGKGALIGSAFAAASALTGVMVDTSDDPEACNAFLDQYVARSGLFSFAGFIDTSGALVCRSGGPEVNFGASPAFAALVLTPRPVVTANPVGAVTRLPVVIATEPVRADGQLVGFVSVSLTARSLELMRRSTGRNTPDTVVLFNSRGDVINVTSDAEPAQTLTLPDGLTLSDLPRRVGEVLRGTDARGQTVLFAVSELLPGRLYAVGQWPQSGPAAELLRNRVLPLILPVLMWLASLGVAFCAVFVLVIRPLRGLNRQMRRFALGQRDAWVDLPADASSEFREINATFRRMARIIARDEAEREEALAEKTVLLKEIHHRVKNNLQLIASIINLQLRDLSDESSRMVLQNVQSRVLSMAEIHRTLYEEQRLTEMRADRVLGEIIHRLVSLGTSPEQRFDIACDLAPVTLSAERIVPFSLLMTEALTNALKSLAQVPAHAGRWIEVTLQPETDGRVRLRLVQPCHGHDVAGPDPGPLSSVGDDLIEAFALQMDASLHQEVVVGPRGQARVTALVFHPDDGSAKAPSAGLPAPTAPGAAG